MSQYSDAELEADITLVIWIAAMLVCSCVLFSAAAVVVSDWLARGF